MCIYLEFIRRKKILRYMELKTATYRIEHPLTYKYESPYAITLNLGLKYTSTTEMNKLQRMIKVYTPKTCYFRLFKTDLKLVYFFYIDFHYTILKTNSSYIYELKLFILFCYWNFLAIYFNSLKTYVTFNMSVTTAVTLIQENLFFFSP